MPHDSLEDVLADYEILERDDQWRLLIELGQQLEPMPSPLKTEATQVRGCLSQVWTYPLPPGSDGRLHFLADSTSAFTKGMIALVLMVVQDRTAEEILATPIEQVLEPFQLDKHLSSGRTSGLPNMIALVRDTARRLAA